MLYQFVSHNRDDIIRRCREKVATRSVPPHTDAEIDHGVPLFIDQLVEALAKGVSNTNADITSSSILHGHDRLLQGLTVSQVVHDYGDICQSITDLAVELNAPITNDDFRTLNGCLDDAIAGAVTEYGRERNQATIETETARGKERAGFLAHELRNLLNTSIMAFEALQTGNVGVGGSTAKVLHRSLMGARGLINQSLVEVRLAPGAQHRVEFLIDAFIDEVASAAELEADAKGVTLTVVPVQHDVAIEADRQILGAVVSNLLQNAFKFTKPHSTVTLRVGANAQRVLIEVEDECGGLPAGNIHELFRPFEQRGADRTGVGLGLAFSRWGVEANGGRLYARSLPDKGCIFTVDVARAHQREAAPAVAQTCSGTPL